MSKTLGNVIDPLDTIKDFGTDALRFTLALGTAGQVCFPFEFLEFHKCYNSTGFLENCSSFHYYLFV